MYSLTSKGHRIYPTREPFLLKSFISFLKKRGEESTIEEFFHTFWEDRHSKAERKIGEVEDDKEEQLQRLADLLSEEGFMPEIEYSEESGTVVDRKSTRLNSSHVAIAYAVGCVTKHRSWT